MDDRIRLAEAMGWKRGRISTVTVMGRSVPHQRWIDPDGSDRPSVSLPNPFEDANDCDALIRFLNERGFTVTTTQWDYVGGYPERSHGKHGVRLDYVAGTYSEWTGDDYKQGVCKLALKVISDG